MANKPRRRFANVAKSTTLVIDRIARGWNPTQPDHPKYRPDIDGLRAIAVLSVVGFHAAPGRIPSGFIGVDIFFVISGYLISSIILKGLEAGTFTFAEFYSRRVKRIFPALLLTLLLCMVVGYFILLEDQFKQLAKHVAGGAGFVSNLILWGESGYFDDAAEYKPMLHLWSLGIEEQFYIFWPFLLWLVWKQRLNCLAAILAIAVASFALNLYAVSNDVVVAFYSPFTRFWELMIGAVLAYVRVFMKPKRQITRQGFLNLSSASGLALFAIAFLAIDSKQPFPGMRALLPTVGTAFMIWAGPSAWLNRNVLSNRLLVWFGLISYPLYLWHWPLLSFLRVLEGTEVAQWKRASAICIAIALAWLTFRLVEKPIREGSRGKFTTLFLLVSMSVIGLVGSYGYFNNGFAGRSATPRIVNAGEIGELSYLEYVNKQYFPCTPLEIRNEAAVWNGIVRCFQSKKDPIRNVAIIGDSHAGHLFPGLAARMLGSNVVQYGKEGLPFVSNREFRRIFETLLGDRNITVVLISAYWGRDLKQYTSNEWKHELTETVSKLVSVGKVIYLIEDVPTFSFKPYRCKYAGRLGVDNICSEPDRHVSAQYLPGFETIATKVGRDKVKVIRAYDLFCKDGSCSMARDGVLFFRDEHHLNVSGSAMVANSIAEQMLEQ